MYLRWKGTTPKMLKSVPHQLGCEMKLHGVIVIHDQSLKRSCTGQATVTVSVMSPGSLSGKVI